MCLVGQLCPTFCKPMDCSPPGCSVHGSFQAGILQLAAISYSRDRTLISCVSCIGKWILYHWATREAPNKILISNKMYKVLSTAAWMNFKNILVSESYHIQCKCKIQLFKKGKTNLWWLKLEHWLPLGW